MRDRVDCGHIYLLAIFIDFVEFAWSFPNLPVKGNMFTSYSFGSRVSPAVDRMHKNAGIRSWGIKCQVLIFNLTLFYSMN